MLLNYTLTTENDNTKFIFLPNTELNINDTIIIESESEIIHIIEWYSAVVKYTGDKEYLQLKSEFKYKTKDSFTEWKTLNDTNLKAIGSSEKILFNFRFTCLSFNPSFDLLLDIKPSDINGYFRIVEKNSTTPYIIPYDYPTRGIVKYKIGYLKDGDYHININTSKIYVKKNGVWSNGTLFTSVNNVYTPISFNDVLLNDTFIESITSQNGLVPINDIILTDIKFGTDINNLHSTPLQGDNIYVNKNFNMVGLEQFEISYTYEVLPVNYIKKILLESIILNTNYHILTATTEPLVCLTKYNEQIIFKPPFTLKMFSITSFSIEVNGICSDEIPPCLDVKFRYSFDSRKMGAWTPLTIYNLKCIRGTPLKFFYIEFLVTKICNDNTPICISDIVINGDIQNVTSDYQKTNRFGIRSDCNYNDTISNYDPSTGQCIETTDCMDSNVIPTEWTTDTSDCVVSNLFKPYDTTKILALAEKNSNDISNMFGWEIDYYKTETDVASIDYVMHEYGTLNTTNKQKIKIILPDNKFPEDTISFNMFNLALFDSFEIHVTKKEFFSKFGVGVRPAKDDFMWICQINKWFKVDHTQSFRDFMNSSIYYKLTLTKKEDNKNIDNGDYKSEFDDSIRYNQQEQLFNNEVMDDVNHLINDKSLQNLTELQSNDAQLEYDSQVLNTKDMTDYKKPNPLQFKVLVKSFEASLENGRTIISQNYYNLSSRINNVAITYQQIDNDICDCCNRSYTAWFSITKYNAGMNYNFIDNYDSLINKGYKINFIDGNLKINYFNQEFVFDISISVNVWYALVVNFNSTMKKIEVFVYKRFENCGLNELELIDEIYDNLTPVSFNGDLTMKINGSDMNITNIRIFDTVIPKDNQMKSLHQSVIKNSENIILIDNADKNIKTQNNKF